MRRYWPLALLIALLVTAGVVIAQALYSADWWTADGGGGQAVSGGDYSAGVTIGQPDAGAASGGDYELSSGFWSARPTPTPTPTQTPTTTVTPTSSVTPTPVPGLSSGNGFAVRSSANYGEIIEASLWMIWLVLRGFYLIHRVTEQWVLL